jgi:biopolymer transport protein ExbB/TolQ
MAMAGLIMGWLSVAIVVPMVIVAGVMLVKKPVSSSRLPVNRDRFLEQMNVRLQKLDQCAAKARAEFPKAPTESWHEMAEDMAKARQLMTELAGIGEDDQEAVQDKLREVQEAYNDAKKDLRKITGKEDSGDSDPRR